MKLTVLTYALFGLSLIPLKFLAQSLPPAEFQKKLQKEKGILIDVRTPEEYDAEKIKGAININVNGDHFREETLKLDKKKSYFLYCGIGKRSAKAMKIMKEEGFEKVYELEKGLGEWKAQGLPTEKKE